MSKIARIYQGTNEIQKYYQGGVLQRLFFDWKHYIGNELNIEYAKECAGRNIVISGKTYQNLFNAELSQGHVYGSVMSQNKRVNSGGFTLDSTTYTICVPSGYEVLVYKNFESSSSVYIGWANKLVWTNSATTNNIRIMIRKANDEELTVDEVIGKVILLEGDYTNIDIPNNINGIESVAEKERNLANNYIVKAIGTLGAKVIFDNKNCLKITSTFSRTITLPDISDYKIYVRAYANNTENKSYSIGNFNDTYISPGIKKWQSTTLTGNLNKFSIYNYQNSEVYIDLDSLSLERVVNPYPLKLAINEEINLINLPIPLRSLPNGVCDIIEENRLVQRVGKVVLDESNASNFKQVNTMQVFRWEYFFDTKEFVSGICDNFPIKNVQTLANENRGIRLSGNNFKCLDIKFPDDTGFDINAFRTWLSENPVTVYYELATPIETPITPDMILINGEPITDTVSIELPNGTKDSIENDYYVKRVGKVTYNGQEDWKLGTTSANIKVFYLINNDFKELSSMLCGSYKVQTTTLGDKSIYCGNSWRPQIRDDSCSTVDEFKQLLSENPVTVWYELATPDKIPLFSIKEGLTILKSTNNITPQIELDCLVRDDFQNMCDNMWESGDINLGGVNYDNINRIRLVNYIELKPNTIYRLDITNSVPILNSGIIGTRFYNSSKKYLGNDLAGNIKSPTYTFITPADCYYIRFIAETRDTNFKIYLKEVIE